MIEEHSLESISTQPPTKRRIRFCQELHRVVCEVPARCDVPDEEKKETWWLAKEYHGIRLAAKLVTREVRMNEKELVQRIDEAFSNALHLSCTLGDEDFKVTVNDPTAYANCLHDWCARPVSGRGLERYTSLKHRVERTEFAKEARAAVLRLARNNEVNAEQLSEFYREYSRSALMYARLTGHADWKAVEDNGVSTSLLQDAKKAIGRREHLVKTPSRRGLVRQISNTRIEQTILS